LFGCLWLVCCEKKILLADWWLMVGAGLVWKKNTVGWLQRTECLRVPSSTGTSYNVLLRVLLEMFFFAGTACNVRIFTNNKINLDINQILRMKQNKCIKIRFQNLLSLTLDCAHLLFGSYS